ncbi:MAG: hypothetical protein WCY32_05160 [Burkholderiaceae bacterium]
MARILVVPPGGRLPLRRRPVRRGGLTARHERGQALALGLVLLFAAVLGLFFGPLGMIYSTGIGALIMFMVSLVLLPLTLGAGALFTIPACAIWAAHAATEHNKKLRERAYLQLQPAAPQVQYLPPASSPRS